VHPVRPLRTRLRRHPGQRRHRPVGQGLLDADRVRSQRPDGLELVRHVRRMRAGLSHRSADQQGDSGRRDPSARGTGCGAQRVPVLRRRAVRSRITWIARSGAISFVEGRDQPGSQSRLCVKGRYGWDYSRHPNASRSR
jgi:hypothetical protein